MLFSERALALIIGFEGLNQPGKWPGGASGITLGYGYDLGHVTAPQFHMDWAGCFSPGHVTRLTTCVGCTGATARRLAPSVADIRCTVADARRVLVSVSLPVYVARARRAFPGFDVLPLDVQGALVSLVYNRGTRMADSPGTDDRREMRAIRDLVAEGLVVGIPEQLRSMQRLWIGKGLDGLIRRREAEAQLVESAIAAGLRALGHPGVSADLETRPVVVRGAGTARHHRDTRRAPAFGASRKAIVLPELEHEKTRRRSPGHRAASPARRRGRRPATGRSARRTH